MSRRRHGFWNRTLAFAALGACGALMSIGTASAAGPAPQPVTGESCKLRGKSPIVKGTLLYDQAVGGRPVAVFSGVLVPATVSAIPLSPAKGSRVRISTSGEAPAFRLDGYVALAEVPIFTTRDLPVVEPHIWIASQQDVKIVGATADTLRVEHRIDGTQDQSAKASGPCDAFALAPTSYPQVELVGSKARGYRMRVTTLPLYDRPGGSVVYTLNMRDLATLLFWGRESKSGYTHVTGRSDIVIDAWVKHRGLEAMRPGELMDPYIPSPPAGAQIGLNEQPPVLIASKDVPIRPGPEPEEPIIGYIEKGAEFYQFSYIEGWATVLPKSLVVKPPEGGGFWVPEIDVMP